MEVEFTGQTWQAVLAEDAFGPQKVATPVKLAWHGVP